MELKADEDTPCAHPMEISCLFSTRSSSIAKEILHDILDTCTALVFTVAEIKGSALYCVYAGNRWCAYIESK